MINSKTTWNIKKSKIKTWQLHPNTHWRANEDHSRCTSKTMGFLDDLPTSTTIHIPNKSDSYNMIIKIDQNEWRKTNPQNLLWMDRKHTNYVISVGWSKLGTMVTKSYIAYIFILSQTCYNLHPQQSWRRYFVHQLNFHFYPSLHSI